MGNAKANSAAPAVSKGEGGVGERQLENPDICMRGLWEWESLRCQTFLNLAAT
jgi:hypothetical protein